MKRLRLGWGGAGPVLGLGQMRLGWVLGEWGSCEAESGLCRVGGWDESGGLALCIFNEKFGRRGKHTCAEYAY